MHPILEKYLELLWEQFQNDMDIFSKPWMYYLALIPASAYLIFFIVKWAVLTTPVWLPPFLVLQSFNFKRWKQKEKSKNKK